MARNEGMLMVDALIEAKKRIAELEAEVANLTARPLSGFEGPWFAYLDMDGDVILTLRRRGVNPSGESSLSARKATPKTRLFNQATNQWEEVG